MDKEMPDETREAILCLLQEIVEAVQKDGMLMYGGSWAQELWEAVQEEGGDEADIG